MTATEVKYREEMMRQYISSGYVTHTEYVDSNGNLCRRAIRYEDWYAEPLVPARKINPNEAFRKERKQQCR